MREYEHVASLETIEAVRLLRGAWSGWSIDRSHVRIRLEDARVVRLRSERAEPGPDFEAWSIAALIEADGDDVPVPARESDFSAGGNDIVLFRGETWLERPAPSDDADPAREADAGLLFSGRPGMHSPDALALCTTSDAVLVAATSGAGVLVKLGALGSRLEVVEDKMEIARFLGQRGYA